MVLFISIYDNLYGIYILRETHNFYQNKCVKNSFNIIFQEKQNFKYNVKKLISINSNNHLLFKYIDIIYLSHKQS